MDIDKTKPIDLAKLDETLLNEIKQLGANDLLTEEEAERFTTMIKGSGK